MVIGARLADLRIVIKDWPVGKWRRPSQWPALWQYAGRWKISQKTVRRDLDRLAAQGYLRCKMGGSGWFAYWAYSRTEKRVRVRPHRGARTVFQHYYHEYRQVRRVGATYLAVYVPDTHAEMAHAARICLAMRDTRDPLKRRPLIERVYGGYWSGEWWVPF